MRFLRTGPLGSERPAVATDDGTFDISSVLDSLGVRDIGPEFFAAGGIDAVHNSLGALPATTPAERIGSPIAAPGKIVCIGLNYRDHAAETNAAIPDEPIVFMKDPSTIVGPNDDVLIPPTSTKTDWEVELGIVIGAEARYLASPDEASSCIAGYVVSHDVSEREYQLERGGQWDKGKSCETFNPLGPELVTADEVDPSNLRLTLSVNGISRQDGTTANLIFDVPYVVWYLSQFMVLRPGDLVNTGTPAGVALGLPDHPYLREGDVVDLAIEGLGAQRSTFRRATTGAVASSAASSRAARA
ncbi:2-keto-4-pentenoate hydratase/2-oxohepta-3-ene-1,7-dioic acid hydratase in catechol pathway [Frondihabitans sp. PhB188]|uniref:fumarylacetoacetate hydrolase family protein n=1 Tax=Frondihabitans sp. PhB188 TaxID=2485200 RepID=UPI000F484689|nr:fumarylacetoacetate hydrolase family protein [Frondihabitans sp. PhB188]ROQ41525.1 2-keto-4-pentenoate hydratase/2-oxohepta-3-ene-1,7-dioic acid hydratase in catechol pathway [Frondihabitans sp. PhB188]